jgi:Type I restriction modification DNA specificity domain
VPVLRMGNIVAGRLVFGDMKYLPQTHGEFPALFLRPGDVLFNRTNSPELVGKSAVYSADDPAPCAFASYLIRLQLRGYQPKLLVAYLNSGYGRAWVRSCVVQQVGQANVSGGKLKELELPVPPEKEQRRIVGKLEALQTRSRRVREALARIDELEEELVHSWTRKGYPVSTLEAHVVQKTGEVGDKWRDYPLVGLSNEGRITERREAIGQKTAHKCRLVETGDVVFNPIRFSIGSIARYRGESPAIVSPEYQVFSTRPTLSAELLVRYLRSRLGKSTLENETTGSVRYRVYFKDLQRIEVPLAPPEVQAKAERLLAYLARLREDSRALQRDLATMDRAVLTRTFRGDLVPQDPNDEPAEAMLARLRNENNPPSSRENASGVGIPRAHVRKAI